MDTLPHSKNMGKHHRVRGCLGYTFSCYTLVSRRLLSVLTFSGGGVFGRGGPCSSHANALFALPRLCPVLGLATVPPAVLRSVFDLWELIKAFFGQTLTLFCACQRQLNVLLRSVNSSSLRFSFVCLSRN